MTRNRPGSKSKVKSKKDKKRMIGKIYENLKKRRRLRRKLEWEKEKIPKKGE